MLTKKYKTLVLVDALLFLFSVPASAMVGVMLPKDINLMVGFFWIALAFSVPVSIAIVLFEQLWNSRARF